MNKNCDVCNKILTGKKRKYCSKICQKTGITKFCSTIKDEIKEYYVNQKLSLVQIAKKLNITRSTVSRYINLCNFPHRRHKCDFTNKKYGRLTAIRVIGKTSQGRDLWECLCDCGNITKVQSSYVTKTQSCGCLRTEMVRTRCWKGYGEIGKKYYNNTKNGAIARNIEFNITLKDMWEKFIEQNRLCIYTNKILTFSHSKLEETTASLDRIDSTKGYIIDNIQWVHKIINRMKSDMSNEEFIMWCRLISNNQS